jgi:hypothetical protein
MTEISYSGYRFPPEIIQQAILLWWLFAYFVVITIGKPYLSPITKPSRRSHDRALSRHFRLVVPLAIIYGHYGCNDRLPSERALRADGFGAQRKILGAL